VSFGQVLLAEPKVQDPREVTKMQAFRSLCFAKNVQIALHAKYINMFETTYFHLSFVSNFFLEMFPVAVSCGVVITGLGSDHHV